MTDKHIFRASSPADLLALVPGLLGFHPEDSLVLMTVGQGPDPLHVRVDLPPPGADPVAVEDYVAHLATLTTRTGLRRFVVVVYTGDAGLAEAVTDPLAARLAVRGADVECAVRAHEGRWWLVGAGSDEPGAAYDVASHPFTAQFVVEGAVVLGSRRALAASLRGDTAAERAEAAEIGALLAAGPRRPVAAEAGWVSRRVRGFVADGRRLDTADAARLVRAVSGSVALRDVAWVEITRDDAARHVDLWRDVVRRVPKRVRAAPASLLGFAAWLSGDGALAWCAVDRALEADPKYGLAGLLTDVLAAGMPPSRWRGIPPGDLPLSVG